METVTATPTQTFPEALAAFVAATQAKIDANYAEYRGEAPRLSVDKGRVNMKIVSNGPGAKCRSVFCFVRIADGAVLKAEGWNKPAKHVRGSIYINAGQDAVGVYGANYISR